MVGKTNKQAKRVLITVLILFLLLCTSNVTVASKLSSVEQLGAGKVKVASKYDLRDSIDIKLKDQMSSKCCWAFAATTVLETYMAKVKNKNVEFSPRHMEYATSRTFLDGINDVAFNRELDSGGSAWEVSAYLTSGMGPVYEKDMPFINSSEKIKLSEIKNKQIDFMVKEYIEFPRIFKEVINGQAKYSNGQEGQGHKEYTYSQVVEMRDKVKEHITKYGAVMTMILAMQEYFSADWKSLFCNESSYTTNHGVTIIGWDDNYSVENFRQDCRPSSPGAWLVQNSTGEFAPYFYISYEDVWVNNNIWGIKDIENINYDRIYQHDYLGKNGQLFAGSNTCKAINVFSKSEKKEFLNQISFSTYEDEEYEIYINPTDGTTDENKFEKIKSIGKTDSSYITIELEKPIELTNTKFAVMVKYTNPNGNAKVPIEAAQKNENKFLYCTSSEGESFYVEDGKITDMKKLGSDIITNANACIKAFTTLTNQDDKTLLSSSKYVIDSENMIKNVLPKTTLNNFNNNIISNTTYNIKDKKNSPVTDNSEIIKTGMRLEIDGNKKYTIIVKGDNNGDGNATGTDLLRVKKHIIEQEKLDGDNFIAADLNNNGTVTSTDLWNLAQYICEIVAW